MRIRSIKPEFWRSEDVAALPLHTRLTFIGLWSYVDDNGVGRDDPRIVAAELFSLDDDPRESLARVRGDLARLSEGGLIVRYQVSGRPYLYVATWEKHQRVDKPNKERYPKPDDPNAVLTSRYRDSRETLATVPRDLPETLAPGTEEQGSSGTGEQVPEPTVPGDAAAVAAAPTAQTLIAEWIDHCRDRPPGKVTGQVSQLVGQMLGEGIPYDHVRAGLAAWQQKGLHPATLPSVVHETRTQHTRATATHLSTTDQRVAVGMNLTRHFEALEEGPS